MKIFKQVHGSQEQVLPIEINVDTVYIRDNIEKTEDGWVYDEKQLSLNEYFRQIIPYNQNITDDAIAELSMLFVSFNERLMALEGASK